MKKILGFLCCFLMILSLLCGCNGNRENLQEENHKIKIVTTMFPEYDWVMNILGDNPAGAQVSMLLDKGVDLHSYQPSVDDIYSITTCDVFIYTGGASDRWVEDALAQSRNEDMIVINLLDYAGDYLRQEEDVPGGEKEREQEEQEEEPEYDEHIWLSLKASGKLVAAIEEALEKADPENSSYYRKNCDSYVKKLTDLDNRYQQVVASSRLHTLIFGDRFPFRYMIEDYGLSYYAAFSGCSAETQASFETLTGLSKQTDKEGVKALLIIDGSDGLVAKTIANTTLNKHLKILRIDSMQSINRRDLDAGISYLKIMRDNLQVLKEALS